MSRLLTILVSITSLAAAAPLNYATFKTKVEPVFLKKREGHSRCVVCHSAAHNAFHLEPLDAGKTTWTEAQSKKNFAMVSLLVTPGNPEKSKLLIHPLAQDAGGDEFHSGGRQFESKDDPDWKAIADWVRRATSR